MTILLPVLAFLFVALLAYAAYIALAPSLAGHVERRLAESTSGPGGQGERQLGLATNS